MRLSYHVKAFASFCTVDLYRSNGGALIASPCLIAIAMLQVCPPINRKSFPPTSDCNAPIKSQPSILPAILRLSLNRNLPSDRNRKPFRPTHNCDLPIQSGPSTPLLIRWPSLFPFPPIASLSAFPPIGSRPSVCCMIQRPSQVSFAESSHSCRLAANRAATDL